MHCGVPRPVQKVGRAMVQRSNVHHHNVALPQGHLVLKYTDPLELRRCVQMASDSHLGRPHPQRHVVQRKED
jgi:hypothetical protein